MVPPVEAKNHQQSYLTSVDRTWPVDDMTAQEKDITGVHIMLCILTTDECRQKAYGNWLCAYKSNRKGLWIHIGPLPVAVPDKPFLIFPTNKCACNIDNWRSYLWLYTHESSCSEEIYAYRWNNYSIICFILLFNTSGCCHHAHQYQFKHHYNAACNP